jgi:hypothetical protein
MIDSVVEDLNDNGDLPEHGTVKYRRPRVILPEDCPLMVVWLILDEPTPQTTKRFDTGWRIGVSWHEQAVDEAKTLTVDEALSLALIDAVEKIKARFRAIATGGLADVPEAYEFLPGSTRYLAEELAQGLTEGYVTELLAATIDG